MKRPFSNNRARGLSLRSCVNTFATVSYSSKPFQSVASSNGRNYSVLSTSLFSFPTRHNRSTNNRTQPGAPLAFLQRRSCSNAVVTATIKPTTSCLRFHEEVVAKAKEGRELELAGEYEDALAKYDEAINIERNDPLGWNSKGQLLFKMKKFEEAIDSYEQVVRCQPQYAQTFVDMALCYLNLADPGKAVSLLSDAVFLDPKLVPAYVYRGDIRFANGEMDSAFEDYSMVVTLDGKSVPSWLGIGKVELKRNKLINTRTAFSYALQYAEANHFAAKRTKESVLRQDDDGGMVETSLAQLLETYSLFGVLEQHENNLQAAKECFTKGLRLVFGDDATKPGKPNKQKAGGLSNILSDLYMKRAHAHLMGYDNRLCQQDCDAALVLNPDNHMVWFVRGQSYNEVGIYSAAAHDLSAFLEVDRRIRHSTPTVEAHHAEVQKIIDACKLRMQTA